MQENSNLVHAHRARPHSAAGSTVVLTNTLSLYLDFVRFVAALVVAANHIWPMLFPRRLLPWPGHDAVVVFFVLSGLVVAYATDRAGRSPAIYVEHRLARIWSVAIPALLLSILITPFIAPDITIYAAPVIADRTEFWRAILLNASFLSQSWFLDAAPAFNAPFWSLSFEVWYYILFGLWIYAPIRWKTPALIVACLIAGFKILLLAPVWLFGVAIYRCRVRLPSTAALVIFAATVIVGLIYFWFDVSIMIRTAMIARWPEFMSPLGSANQFVGDICLGIIISLNFIAASNLHLAAALERGLHVPVKKAASFTFSIYLYHMPIFSFLWGALGLRSPAILIALLILGVVGLGQVTERQLSHWRRLVSALLGRATAALRPVMVRLSVARNR
jgi:peptidoglycan/LPS O-acetylase OafA/YrhL